METVIAYVAGLVSFPVLVMICGFLALCFAGYMESFALGLLVVLVSSGILVYGGASLAFFFITYPLFAAAIVFGYFPIGYWWGMKWKLPRAVRKEAEETKKRIERARSELIAALYESVKSDNLRPSDLKWLTGFATEEYSVEKHQHGLRPSEKELRKRMTEPGKSELLATLNKGELPESFSDQFKAHLANLNIHKVSPYKFYDKLLFWIVFWPVSAVVYVFTEMLRDFFSFIGRKIHAAWKYVWTYLKHLVSDVIDKAYQKAGIDHLVTTGPRRDR